MEEHAGKVRAAVEARRNPDFVIIARTEALIAGWGLDEALRRARAYAEAGADLLLVHSKAESFEELRAFARRWEGRVPLVAVPTIYKETTAEELERHGFKVVIFANHAIRASIKAMQETLSEMRDNEKTYLPAGAETVRAVILAAGADQGLLPLTQDRPKCMLDVKGRTILDRQVGLLHSCGIRDIAVVRGYKKEGIRVPGLAYFDNDQFETTGEAVSLFAASSARSSRSCSSRRPP